MCIYTRPRFDSKYKNNAWGGGQTKIEKKNMGKMLEETIILEKKAVERNYASIKITIVKVRQSLL